MKNVLVDESLLDGLAKLVAKRGWRKLGTALGIKDQCLTKISAKRGGETYKAKEMLRTWKEKRQCNATENALKDALEEVGMHDLWKKIKGKNSKDNYKETGLQLASFYELCSLYRHMYHLERAFLR